MKEDKVKHLPLYTERLKKKRQTVQAMAGQILSQTLESE
jgi:hypothetical protein